jgi:phosphatidylglycerol lysyltransferase
MALWGHRVSPPEPEAASRAALAEVVARSPRGNGYISLEPDLAVFRHDHGVVTWAASGRTAFAVGGVHGAADPAALLRAFREHVHSNGFRQVLLFPAAAEEREALESADFECLMVGAEAFIDPSRFSLTGGAMADLRQMLNRGRTRFNLRSSEVEAKDADVSMLEVYGEWLSSRPSGHRLQLLVGTPRLAEPFARRYFVARDGHRTHAMVTLTPGWGGTGYGLDVMARAPDAAAGAMEIALTGAIETLGSEGVEVLSLGACPMFEATPVPDGDSPLLRAILRWVYRSRFTRRLFPFESLPRFKAKFRPTWEPSFIAAWPHAGVRSLYVGCRMWGLFGPRSLRKGLSRAD